MQRGSFTRAAPTIGPLKRKLLVWLGVLVVAAAVLGYVGWFKFFREEAQPDWVNATPDMRFKYGSIGAERDAGIPYWIFYVLPRMFPEKLPGPGGYASFGVPWEQGQELPVGFTKKTIGFPRVANTCAVCHTATYRTSADDIPVFITAGNGHTTNAEAFFRFLVDCAKDPRFNADNLMNEIGLVTHMSLFDRLSYRFLIIPMTKKRLIEREAQFKWIYRTDFPEWGRGRDDAMNLTKYFMIKMPMDDTFGPTDMPSIWNLQKYQGENRRLNWAGDSHDARSVVIDSALGLLGAPPHNKKEFTAQIDWLFEFLSKKPAPKYPFAIDKAKVVVGEDIFDKTCANCHASGKTGTRIALTEVGTDKDRLLSWSKQAAIEANRIVKDMGIERRGLVEEDPIGYDAPFLDGIWLRAPYLHNGSVPTMRDLLTPPEQRTKVFWRGYDVYDPVDLGFVSQGAEAERVGTKHDTSQRGGRNIGHAFGTNLPAPDKDALIEYLKTL